MSLFSLHSLFEKKKVIALAILVLPFFPSLSFPLVHNDLDLLFPSDLAFSFRSSFIPLTEVLLLSRAELHKRLPQPTGFGTKCNMGIKKTPGTGDRISRQDCSGLKRRKSTEVSAVITQVNLFLSFPWPKETLMTEENQPTFKI